MQEGTEELGSGVLETNTHASSVKPRSSELSNNKTAIPHETKLT
jgi:hypothetical protein